MLLVDEELGDEVINFILVRQECDEILIVPSLLFSMYTDRTVTGESGFQRAFLGTFNRYRLILGTRLLLFIMVGTGV
jgi:hypothetical protein